MFVDNRTGIEIIERRECLALLAADDFGRIGILEGASPLILPVNYALDGEAIIFRSGEGSKLAAARRTAACFEIDGHDSARHEGWSVVARGRLEEVTPYEGPALERLAALEAGGRSLGGAIVGRALYEGAFSLEAALAAAKGR